MKPNKDPCYQCTKRYVGCHSKCEEYRVWAHKVLELHKSIREQKLARYLADEYVYDRRKGKQR